VLESARRYKYKWEWKKFEFKLYLSACRKGILARCMAHMPARAKNVLPRPPLTQHGLASHKVAAAKRAADPEWRRKNAEVRAAIATRRRGSKISEETRLRMSIAAKNRSLRPVTVT